MLIKRIYIAVLLIIVLIVINLRYNYTQQEDIEVKISELTDYAHIIDGININDTVYDDLDFLKDILKDKRIVLLGEQTHTDGSTFEAKARLIKFLHQKLGFDVVLYEAGLYDMWYMNNQKELDPSLGLYSFWWDNDKCRDLWTYLDSMRKGPTPIALGGFDVQLTGMIDKPIRTGLLKTYLAKKNINLNEYQAFNNTLDIFTETWRWQYKKLGLARYDSIQSETRRIIDLLVKDKSNLEDEIYIRYLDGIEQYNALMWQYSPGDITRMNARDSLMANNFTWLADSVYKDRKIIVWAANLHTFKNDLDDLEPMGSYLKEQYGDTSYMLAFTSYKKVRDKDQVLNIAGNKAAEYLLHQKGYKYCFFNMADIPQQSYLWQENISVINQFMYKKSNWGDMADGIFYIDRIEVPKK